MRRLFVISMILFVFWVPKCYAKTIYTSTSEVQDIMHSLEEDDYTYEDYSEYFLTLLSYIQGDEYITTDLAEEALAGIDCYITELLYARSDAIDLLMALE